jgi:hypothetical protein
MAVGPVEAKGRATSHGRRRPIVPITSRRTCNPSATAGLARSSPRPGYGSAVRCEGRDEQGLGSMEIHGRPRHMFRYRLRNATRAPLAGTQSLPKSLRVDMKESIETHREGSKTIENRSVSGPDHGVHGGERLQPSTRVFRFADRPCGFGVNMRCRNPLFSLEHWAPNVGRGTTPRLKPGLPASWCLDHHNTDL